MLLSFTFFSQKNIKNEMVILYTLLCCIHCKNIESHDDNNIITFVCSYGYTPGHLSVFSHDNIKTGIGGSETALIELSSEFAKSGYKVIIYNKCVDEYENKSGFYHGEKDNYVEYRDIDSFNPKLEYNIIIYWKYPFISYFKNVKAKQKYFWIHDSGFDITEYGCIKKTLKDKIDVIQKNLTKIIVVSDYFKEVMKYSIPENKIVVIENGIGMKKNKDEKRIHNYIIHTPPLDRGIIDLLEIWPNIRNYDKNAELHVFNDTNKIYIKKTHDKVKILLNQDGITYHGMVGKTELSKWYSRCALYVYPTKKIETFSISTWEAISCGCIPIVYNTQAVSDVKKCNGIVLDIDKTILYDTIIKMLNPDTQKETLKNMIDIDLSWKTISNKWIKLFNDHAT